MMICHEGRVFVPIFQHTAIDQDHPVGERDTFREHAHDLYHFVLYTRSTGRYVRNGRWRPVSPGTFVIISPGEPHDFVTGQGSSIYSEITFSLETGRGEVLTLPFETVLRLYTGTALALRPEERLAADVADEVLVLMVQVTDYLQSHTPLGGYYAGRTLARLFDIVIGHCCLMGRGPEHALVDQRIAEVRQHIDAQYAAPLQVEHLAARAHMSKRQLFRAFAQAYHTSPVAYQQTLRLEAACTLLRSTHLRCNEVARRVGYANAYYFHRVFKKNVGMTPGQYRARTTGRPACEA